VWVSYTLGAVILVIGLAFPTSAAQLFAFVPIAAAGAFLIMAGTDLATRAPPVGLSSGLPRC
jgi:MFS superfamily sulfate permease-like transporter